MSYFLLALTILAFGAQAEHSMSYSTGKFTCYISECGCPGAFLQAWCSKITGAITAEWCNEFADNCEQCTGFVCYEGEEPESDDAEEDETNHCYINQCGCPGSFKEMWCTEDTSKITSPWCGESEEHCGMCQGSYCSADLEVIPLGPTGECFISQCGCPESFGQEWCTETVAKITSEFCTMNENNCGNCAGTYCPGTVQPTPQPTAQPTALPTALPTAQPTPLPTAQPTALPTAQPTPLPTAQPTPLPTAQPTPQPTWYSMSYGRYGSYGGRRLEEFNSYGAGPEGWCSGGVDDELEPTVSAEACWAQCAGKYPDSLVSIDWYPAVGGECHCQDSCDCMSGVGEDWPGAITLITTEMNKPDECPAEILV